MSLDTTDYISIASAQSYAENSASSISADASDPDGSSLSYSLSGNDAAAFSISSTGVLRFITEPNYEQASDFGSNNVFDVTVSASDGSFTSSVSLAISITDDASDNFGIQLPANVAIAELQEEIE